MKYHGYQEKWNLPIKKGDEIIVPKGIIIFTTHPKYEGGRESKKSLKVKVDHVLPGRTDGDKHLENPMVCWAGSGGYWCEVDINDVLED